MVRVCAWMERMERSLPRGCAVADEGCAHHTHRGTACVSQSASQSVRQAVSVECVSHVGCE